VQRTCRAEGARPNLRQLRDIGGRGDRRLAQILLLGIGPGDALHVDLDAGVLLLEDVERLAHLRRLGIVKAECDRGIRSRNADGYEPSESSNCKPSNAKRAIIRPSPKTTLSPLKSGRLRRTRGRFRSGSA
jgi:hypothetical protein